MVLQGFVPDGKTVTVGIDSPPVFRGFLASVNGQIDGPAS